VLQDPLDLENLLGLLGALVAVLRTIHLRVVAHKYATRLFGAREVIGSLALGEEAPNHPCASAA
jgi:hypothetical protein